MVVWLVPSTAILDQTITALKDEGHHYRAALLQSFNRNFAVMTKAEALAMSKTDVNRRANGTPFGARSASKKDPVWARG